MIKISIIVPVFEGKDFTNSFFSFFEQFPLPSEVELIIVDNGSHNLFYSSLLSRGNKTPNCTVVKYSLKQSSYAARNYGALQAKGSVLAFTDFDCILSKAYIDLLLAIDINLKNIISGKVELFYVKNNIYEFFDNNYYLDQKRYAKNKKGATANLVVPKLIFEDLNGFSEFTSGGDGEFCHRVNLHGYGFQYNEDLIIGHPARNSLKDHLIKAKRIGRGTGQFILSHNNSKVKILLIVLKNLLLIPFPFHQIKIGMKIVHENNLNISSLVKLISLLYKVSFYQRINIVKTILKS